MKNKTLLLLCFILLFSNSVICIASSKDSISGYEFINKAKEFSNNNIEKSLEFLEKAKLIAKSKSIPHLELECNLVEFEFFNLNDENKKAINLLIKSIDLAKKLKDDVVLAEIYNKIGATYIKIELLDKALDFFQKAHAVYTLTGNKKGLKNTLNNIGVIYYYKDDIPNAFEYMEKSLQIERLLNDKDGIATSLNNIGGMMLIEGSMFNPIKAKSYFLEAEGTCIETNNFEQLSNVYNNLGEFYVRMKQYPNALNYFQKALAYSDTIHNISTKILTLDNISQVYESYGDYKSAFNYYTNSKRLKDSLYSVENTKMLAELETKYQAKEREKENELLKKNNEIHELEIQQQKDNLSKQKIYIISGIIVVLVLLGASIFLVRSNREKQKNNKMITEQKAQIEDQHKLLAQKNKDTIDSIIYAKRIQEALLKGVVDVSVKVPEHFVLFQPKDIVSGDFHWTYEQENYWYVAAVDCTGHGVPGAFLTMLGTAYLNEICSNNPTISPATILDKLRDKIILELNQSGKNTDTKDGMDISLARINLSNYTIDWAGANNPIYYFHNNELNVIKADKQPIGYVENSSPFSNHTIQLNKNDSIYLFTDGYADQFGGPKGKKFKYSQLKEKLSSLQSQVFKKQKNELEKTFNNWKGGLEQIDDVCIIGVKL